MIIRSFLQWIATAPADARAEGASALARAYLTDVIDRTERTEAETALVALLDDPSPTVRMALANEVAFSPAVPHAIVTALADDRSDIAAVVLEFSPVMTQAELVDAVALGDAVVQAAIARRTCLSNGVAAAIAEVGSLSACIDLCRNDSADVDDLSLSRLVERFGHEPALRESLLERAELNPGIKHDIVVETAKALARFVTDCAWMSPHRAARVVRDAEDQACLAIAAEHARHEGQRGTSRLVAHVRSAGRLTPALILRSLLCGNSQFFIAAMSDLSGMPIGRVSGLLRNGGGLGFSALYAKARLPQSLLPAFCAALVDEPDSFATFGRGDGGMLQRAKVRRVLAACVERDSADFGTLTALLRRLESEAARDDARVFMLEIERDSRDSMAIVPRPSPADRSLPLRSAA